MNNPTPYKRPRYTSTAEAPAPVRSLPAPTTAERLHVVMISDVYFPRVNGVSTSIQIFRQGLEERGVQVTLIAPDYGEGDTEERVVRIPSRHLPVDPEDRMMRFKSLMRQLTELRDSKVDVVHIQTPFVAHYAGVRWARQLGIPTVESYHTFFEEYLYHYVRFLPRTSLRFLARRFSARQCNEVSSLVVPSQAMLAVLRGYGITTPAAVIPTGIDLPALRGGDRARFRHAHGIALERQVLLYVGRVVFEKNIDFLFSVVKQLQRHRPDILLLVAGEGPAVEPLKLVAKRLDIERNIQFVGYLDRQRDLLDCYAAGDVFVFASRTETQGLVLLEAMALGLPVVSTAVMGIAEVLCDQEGCLIAEDNVTDFTAKVDHLLTDKNLHRALSASALDYTRRWSKEAFVERLHAYYQTVRHTHVK